MHCCLIFWFIPIFRQSYVRAMVCYKGAEGHALCYALVEWTGKRGWKNKCSERSSWREASSPRPALLGERLCRPSLGWLDWARQWVSLRCSMLCAQVLSRVQFLATPWTVAQQAPLSMGFSQQEWDYIYENILKKT